MPNNDLRPGVKDLVILMISRQAVESLDVESVHKSLRLLMATREDCALYRGQMDLVVDGYEEDPRELVDVPEVRGFLIALDQAWPYWGFFFNQVDETIPLFLSCLCGRQYPGGGVVEIDAVKVHQAVVRAFDAMNVLYEKHQFSEADLESQSKGLFEVIESRGFVVHSD